MVPQKSLLVEREAVHASSERSPHVESRSGTGEMQGAQNNRGGGGSEVRGFGRKWTWTRFEISSGDTLSLGVWFDEAEPNMSCMYVEQTKKVLVKGIGGGGLGGSRPVGRVLAY